MIYSSGIILPIYNCIATTLIPVLSLFLFRYVDNNRNNDNERKSYN